MEGYISKLLAVKKALEATRKPIAELQEASEDLDLPFLARAKSDLVTLQLGMTGNDLSDLRKCINELLAELKKCSDI